ncbi:hypothetical protein PMAYCL1PPCAC_21293, partial [Pristionchus mayeri]
QFEHRAFDENPTKNRDKARLTTVSTPRAGKEFVTCLDESRVELGDKKTYIDASWMYDLQHLDRKYIVTQVPMESTMEDFWQMVWEQKALCVALLGPKRKKV